MHICCKFGDCSSKLLQVWTSQISESKWPKWPWRPRWLTSIFNTNLKYPRMHVWYKFGDCSYNPLQVIAQTSWILYNSESKWPKWPWRPRWLTPIFNTNRKYPRMHVWYKFGDCRSNPLQVITQQAEFLRFLWRSRSMTSIFNMNREYPRTHVRCKFGDSSSNLWRIIVISVRPERPRSKNALHNLL